MTTLDTLGRHVTYRRIIACWHDSFRITFIGWLYISAETIIATLHAEALALRVASRSLRCTLHLTLPSLSHF